MTWFKRQWAKYLCWQFGHDIRWHYNGGEWEYSYCKRCGDRHPPAR